MLANNLQITGPLYNGPRQRISAWQACGADKVLLQAILKGIKSPLTQVPLPLDQPPSFADIPHLQEIIDDNIAQGALRPLTNLEMSRTHHWVPIFCRPKKDGGFRMITNLVKLNRCQATPRFKGDSWDSVMMTFSHPHLTWGITLDLKNYFYHLALHPSTQRWIRIKLQGQGYQVLAMPFGWAASPWWAHKMSLPVRQWLHSQKIPFAWWVDDICILGSTKMEAETRCLKLVQQLTALGLKINVEKSMQEACQVITYLGHRFYLAMNQLHPIPDKTLKLKHAVQKQLRSHRCQPKNLASLAGLLLDMSHSMINLQGLPQQLMSLAGRLVYRSATLLGLPSHHPRVWGQSVNKPAGLRDLLLQCLRAAQNPIPRVFRARGSAPQYRLRTDASDQGWGAVLHHRRDGIWRQAQSMQGPWSRRQCQVHITKREALASSLAMQVTIKLVPEGARLLLESDASATCWCWRKGSKNQSMNAIIQPLVCQVHQKNVFLQVQHIPGQLNVEADKLSREMDPKNYHLRRAIFQQVCHTFRFFPSIDLFANRTNRQCRLYCSWHQDGHPENQGNAFSKTWNQAAWINPPWEIIPRVLKKIGRDGSTALVCLPLWRSAPWWGLLLQMQAAPLLTIKGKSLFRDPRGHRLPPPNWGTLFTVVRGSQVQN
jgi:hypothetical protein